MRSTVEQEESEKQKDEKDVGSDSNRGGQGKNSSTLDDAVIIKYLNA